MSRFDETKDGAGRCSAFIQALMELMKEHRVKVSGSWIELRLCSLEHDDGENGWILDMQDIQRLTDGKQR